MKSVTRSIQGQDPTHDAWVENARVVAENPTKATVAQLQSALSFLQYQRSAVILKARHAGRPASSKTLQDIDKQMHLYGELLRDEVATPA